MLKCFLLLHFCCDGRSSLVQHHSIYQKFKDGTLFFSYQVNHFLHFLYLVVGLTLPAVPVTAQDRMAKKEPEQELDSTGGSVPP